MQCLKLRHIYLVIRHITDGIRSQPIYKELSWAHSEEFNTEIYSDTAHVSDTHLTVVKYTSIMCH